MSSIHDEPTERIPVVPNPHDEPTVQVVRIPGYLWADQEDNEQGVYTEKPRGSMVEPRDSVLAWPPIVIFLVVFVVYAWAVWFGVENINGILYVLLMWTR
jgi:hypothetical protein